MNYAVKNNKTLYYAASGFFVLMLATAVLTEHYYLLAIPFAALLFYTGWISLSLVFFILIASLPFSAEYQFSESLGTDLPDELLMLLVSAVFMFYVIQQKKVFFQTARHPLITGLLLLLSWAVVSSLFSTYPLLSVKFLLAKTWYLGAFAGAALLVFTEKENLKKTALTLAISMLIITMVTLFRHAADGFSFTGIKDAVHPFFRNHVNYSALLVCTMPVWYACWVLTTPMRLKRIIMIISVILLAALILSYARGAWLALITGIITMWLIKKKILLRTFFAIIVMLMLTVGWLIRDDRYLDYAPDHNTTIFHEDFREHLIATYEMKDLSAAERFYRWIAGVRMVPDHWITGFGPGTFYHNYKPYAVPVFETWVSDNPERSTVHNYFLLTAVEQGVPGLLFLMILCAAILYYAQHLFHRAKDLFYKTASLVAGAIFSMILTLNFLSDLIETDKIGSLFFLCIAVLVTVDKKTKNEIANG